MPFLPLPGYDTTKRDVFFPSQISIETKSGTVNVVIEINVVIEMAKLQALKAARKIGDPWPLKPMHNKDIACTIKTPWRRDSKQRREGGKEPRGVGEEGRAGRKPA